MKPLRDRKDRSRKRNASGGHNSKAAASNHHVEVHEIPPDKGKKKKNRDVATSAALASTPLGVATPKRPRLNDTPAQPLPLNLTEANDTEVHVVVVDTFPIDDSYKSLDGSSPISGNCQDGSFSDGLLSSSSSSGQDNSSFSQSVDDSSADSSVIHDIADGPEIAQYRLFKLKPPSTCLLVLLQGGTKMPVRGLAKLRSLYGKVTVFGYEITPAMTDPLPIYCPVNVSYMCLETDKPPTGHGSLELQSDEKVLLSHQLSELEFEHGTPEEVIETLRSDSVVLHLLHHDHKPSEFICQFESYKHLYTGGSAKKELPKPDLAVLGKVGLFIEPGVLTESHRVFKPLQGYDETSKMILQAVMKEGREPSRFMFVGPKNTGKSTALRYQINKLQNKSSSRDVCYLEADPGQTEFTAPACLSLHVVSEPLLGPPFTHHQEPVKMYFLGDVSPKELAYNYLKILELLFQEYREKYSHLPLFINTMGWVGGLGLALLRKLACLTSPTHIIQIVQEGEKPVNVCSPLPDKELEYFDLHTDAADKPLIQPEDTCIIQAKCHSDTYQASHQRELNLLATLSRLLSLNPAAKRITSITPHTVPWCNLAIHVCHMPIPHSELLNVANACVVALCATDKKEWLCLDGEQDKGILNTFASAPVCECLGFGILRAIDHEKELFYVLPAVPSDVLPRVNTLLLGSLAIPDCVLLQHSAGPEAPYVTDCSTSEIPGAQPLRQKTYLKGGAGGKGGKAEISCQEK